MDARVTKEGFVDVASSSFSCCWDKVLTEQPEGEFFLILSGEVLRAGG